MGIGRRLKEARIFRGLTQVDLAGSVGVSKGAIGNYETDISSPNEPILIKLMDVLQIDANYLYQDYISHNVSLTTDELQMVDLWRNAEASAKQIALETLQNHQIKDTLPKAE